MNMISVQRVWGKNIIGHPCFVVDNLAQFGQTPITPATPLGGSAVMLALPVLWNRLNLSLTLTSWPSEFRLIVTIYNSNY